jgi:hypothetical protein
MHRGSIALVSFAMTLSLAGVASAQDREPPPPGSGIVVDTQTPPVRDDVAWREARVPYQGGPLRPGMQLDERTNVLPVYGGVLLDALALSFSIASSLRSGQTVGVVPIAGPFIAAANSYSTPPDPGTGVNPSDYGIAFILEGLMGVAGTALLTYGLLRPVRQVVYDAPEGNPARGSILALIPSAPGATFGASAVLRTF